MTPSSEKPAPIFISGGGVTANCCAHLLASAGFETSVGAAQKLTAPLVMISDAALGLMRDVLARPDLLAGQPRIERRVVSWSGGEPVSMPHDAIVTTGENLLAATFWPSDRDGQKPPSTAFTIHAEPPFPRGEMIRFGDRTAFSAEVRLLLAEDSSACWVEAVADGWLFMIPRGGGRGLLLAVGESLEKVLGQSRHLAPRLELLGEPVACFRSAPGMLDTLQGSDWLACGSSAIAFDPICGDGTAQAVREAILAAATVRAMREGGSQERLLVHYESMLLAAMRRHLRLCAQFYASGDSGAWWREQQAALTKGFDWCTRRLSRLPEPRYALRGFRLVEQEMAA